MSEVERFQKTLTESYKDRDMPKTFCEEYNLKNRDDTWINYLPNWLSNSLRWCIDRLSKLLNRIFKKKINTKITSTIPNYTYCKCIKRSDNWYSDDINRCFDCEKIIND